MSLRDGAETIVNQCLDVSSDESVVVVNDVNDPDLLDALMEVVRETTEDFLYIEYPEPESQGAEPPEFLAEALKSYDVFIAPTKKSLSHTQARIKANENGARGATLPTINKQIWNGALQADYERVGGITNQVWEMMSEHDTVRIETPSGTDLELEIDMSYFDRDIGLIHESGGFGNLPAGEVDGGVIDANGTLVIDHLTMVPERNKGAKVEIRNGEIVAVEQEGEYELSQTMSNVENARNIAEFGFGTNPEATLIGNALQDEKVLGTVHVAFGDNAFYFPEDHERYTQSDIHWDSVCKKPTVWFGDRKVIDKGEPLFMD